MHNIHISDSESECYIGLVQANGFMDSSWLRWLVTHYLCIYSIRISIPLHLAFLYKHLVYTATLGDSDNLHIQGGLIKGTPMMRPPCYHPGLLWISNDGDNWLSKQTLPPAATVVTLLLHINWNIHIDHLRPYALYIPNNLCNLSI